MKRAAAIAFAVVLAACLGPGVGLAEGLSTLEQLKANVTAAQQQVESATQTQAGAQAAYDEAQGVLAGIEEAIANAQADANGKQAVLQERNAAVTTATEAQAAAQEALLANADAIASAQANADATAATAAAALDDAAQAAAQTAAMQEAVQAAQANVSAAQAVIDAEVPDPGTNAGHEEWTAIGLYRYILANTSESDAKHWDAQAAIDILTSGTNTTGHSYKEHEGPVPDGAGAATYQNIYQNVDASSRADAVSLDNFGTALDFIDAYNQCRANENAAEGYSLSTNVGMNCRLMAVAEVQLDTSKDSSVSHTQAYWIGENLSWGRSNPFDGWYTKEKGDYKSGITDFSKVGHYYNIVDQLPDPNGSENPTAGTGFAVHTSAPRYGIAHGQVFHTTSGYSQYNPTITYSTSEFRTQWFTPYYNAQLEAGMHGTTEEQKAANREALEAAQAQLAADQAAYEAALAEQEKAEAAAAAAAAANEAAAEQLAAEQAKTAGLESALAEAQAAVAAAQAVAAEAQAAYDAAASQVEQLKTGEEYAQAKSGVEAAQDALEQATADVAAAIKTKEDADAALLAYTDLSSNGNVAISFETVAFNGQAQEPVPVVAIDQDVLQAGVDFTATYSNNVNAGYANVTITGKGDFHGSKDATFQIDPANIYDATIEDLGSYAYINAAICPSVNATFEGMQLVQGTDFAVEYGENVNVGEGTVKVTGLGNYQGMVGLTFPITPREAVVVPNDAWKYYGDADGDLTATVEGLIEGDSVTYVVKRENGEDIGDYRISVQCEEAQGNYTVTSREAVFRIKPIAVDAPIAAAGLVYNGEPQEGVAAGELFTVSEGIATDAGDYKATAKLKDTEKYCWANGGSDPIEVPWSIAGKPIDSAGLSGIVAKKYTGAAQTQNVVVNLDGAILVAGVDYAVSYKNNVNAGTATVTVTGIGNYGSSISKSFTIAKAANPLVATAKAKSVKYKSVNKKAQTVSKAIVTSKAQGTVTYAKVKKGSSAKLTINKTTGKITVKKGTKKGTYTIKVNVTAAGNKNYTKVTKLVVVKVKVK